MQASEIVSMVVSVGALVVNVLTTVIKDRHDRKMKVDERNSSFRETTWKEVIGLAEDMIKKTSQDCFDDTITEIIFAKTKIDSLEASGSSDADEKIAEISSGIAKKINALCLDMRTDVFLLQTKMNLLKINIDGFDIVTDSAKCIIDALQARCEEIMAEEGNGNPDEDGEYGLEEDGGGNSVSDISEYSIRINEYLCDQLAGFRLIN